VETCKSFKHRAAFFGVVAIIVLALVPAALAGKGGNSGGAASTGTLELSTTAGAAPTSTHFGDTVSFMGTTTAAHPNVELVCSQNGTVVYASLSGWYGNQTPVDSAGGFTTRNMTLSSQAWTGGAADCTATLYYISGLKTVTMATLNLSVSS
jgi:hypothetical protein